MADNNALWTLAGTFLGGLISYFATTLNLRRQLSHQARQADKERRFKLASDVYLKAAEAFGKGIVFLSTYADLKITIEDKAKEQQSIVEAFAKLHVVSKLETIVALQTAQECFARASMELLELRMPLELLSKESDRLTELIAELQTQVSNSLNTIHALSGSDEFKKNATERNRLLQEANQLQGNINELIRNRGNNLHDALGMQIRLSKAAFARAQEYTEKLTVVNLAVRTEMDNPLDEAKYTQLVRDSQTRVRTSLETFVDKIETTTRSQLEGRSQTSQTQ